MSNCKLFFDAYSQGFKEQYSVKIVEIGSKDVNGSLRSVAPSHFEYIGVDFVDGKGVDIVLDSAFVNVVVASPHACCLSASGRIRSGLNQT